MHECVSVHMHVPECACVCMHLALGGSCVESVLRDSLLACQCWCVWAPLWGLPHVRRCQIVYVSSESCLPFPQGVATTCPGDPWSLSQATPAPGEGQGIAGLAKSQHLSLLPPPSGNVVFPWQPWNGSPSAPAMHRHPQTIFQSQKAKRGEEEGRETFPEGLEVS